MSSTATHRIDPLAHVLDKGKGGIRTAVATITLAILWISFEPFAGNKVSLSFTESTANIVNQVGYTALFCIVLFTLLAFTPIAAIVRLFSFSWILVFALLAMSVALSPDPEAAMRAFLFTTIGIATAACVSILPANANVFSKVILLAGGAVLALSYIGIVVFPDAAIHAAGEIETQHVGLWRGVFTHKNIAGPIMATLTFAGIYMFRRGQRWRGFLFALAAFIFVMKTGSKASAALVPLVILMVIIPSMFGMRLLGAIFIVAAIFGTHAFTIGTVFVPLFDDILRYFAPLTTYTGRIEIWNFAKDFLMMNPWQGFGFDSFWRTETTMAAESYFDQTWDARSMIHGHNGFLDVALHFGLPCLVLTIWLLVVGPAFAYARTIRTYENGYLADFFIMIIAFTGMNAALESFYFQRSDPVWLTLVIAAFGLRMTSRFRVLSH